MELGESLSPEDINCLKNRLLLIPEFIESARTPATLVVSSSIVN